MPDTTGPRPPCCANHSSSYSWEDLVCPELFSVQGLTFPQSNPKRRHRSQLSLFHG